MCVGILSLILTACINKTPLLDDENGQPLTRAQMLGEASHWSMKGKLGLKSPDENLNLGVWWTQEGEAYQIDFRGAMAIGSGRISGDPEKGTSLEANGDPPVFGRSPEQLVKKLTGVSIPVSPMKYWVRGLPAPGSNWEGNADRFQQMGWLVEVLPDSRGLPQRILLTRQDVRLKLIVKSWGY